MALRKRSRKRKPRRSLFRRGVRFLRSPSGKVTVALLLILGLAGLLTFNHYYWKYAKLIDAKLERGPFNRTSKILAAPNAVFVGEEISPDEVVSLLRSAGYSEARHNRVGQFERKPDSVGIYPGGMSYFAPEPAILHFKGNEITEIISVSDNQARDVYELEPELITNFFDKDRSKRRLVEYHEIPEVMRNAVLAIEDHRFFDHAGFDVVRTAKAAYDGIVTGKRPRGTSTLTQQLSRGFFLTPEQTYRRKLAELMIAIQLEGRLSKEEILQHYCNQVPLGRWGSFNVMGVGEAAQAYFDKGLVELSLAEAALLAGLIQRPSYLNPYRHPERAKNRRNTVLQAMLRHSFITQEEFESAVTEPVELSVGHIESSNAPYFVDLVNKRLRESFPENDLITRSYWVYTTLDMELQRAAVEAVRIGMAEVDERVRKQRRFRDQEPPRAQCALVALDPLTGEVKAIVGGRDYGQSQLNRVLAKRQPGSAFKPFVYATAINTAIEADQEVLTPITMVDDVPTTFWWDDKPYEPANFSNRIHGVTTLRAALMRSMNIATVKVAERVGFDRVAEMARRAGFGDQIQATPAIALGAYEVTPLDIAGAYTALANGGIKMKPYFIRLVRDQTGRNLIRNRPQEEEVLDPRVAYVVTNMLQDVLRRGTAVRVRAMGFSEPAAGKTGTDDDGWFAGYTSSLLCVVWVGFDDNTDLSIEGSKSALPIWTEFMKRAHELPEYRDPEPFEPVEGIVTVQLDPDTYELATYACPDRTAEVFITGSEPTQYCRLHGGGRRGTLLATNVAGWDSTAPRTAADDPRGSSRNGRGARRASAPPTRYPPPAGPPRQDGDQTSEKKKKGLFGRILDVFR